MLCLPFLHKQNIDMASRFSLPTPRRIPAALFCLVGAFMIIVAAWQGFDRVRFLRDAAVAPGQVTDLNGSGSHPQIVFHADGMRISYPQGGLIFGYRDGQAVQVRYLPEDPGATAVIDDVGAVWGATILVAVLGVCMALGGVAMLREGRVTVTGRYG